MNKINKKELESCLPQRETSSNWKFNKSPFPIPNSLNHFKIELQLYSITKLPPEKTNESHQRTKKPTYGNLQ